MANIYRWQAPGNGKIFDAPLGSDSYMNTRSINVLKYISDKKKVSQAEFDREIKNYLKQHSNYEENNSTPSHFFRPLLFLGFLRMSSSKMISLTLEGDKFLFFYEQKNYKECKKYILNQLDNCKYPNDGTKDIKLQLFPFRVLFKLMLENQDGITKEFIRKQLVYVKEYSDIALYEATKDSSKVQKYSDYDKFYTWVINSLVDIEILKKEKGNYFIADSIYEDVKSLYSKLSLQSFFFSDETLVCQLDNKTAHERYKRDARLIQQAKQRDNFICQVDNTHKTFISKGHNYVEGHHIVPMFQQKNFQFGLDDVDNILSLCPTCHREIHSADEKVNILGKIFELKKEYMVSNNITLNDLEKMYYCS